MQVFKGTMQRYLSLSVFSFVQHPLEHFLFLAWVSKASIRTRLGVPRRSWLWGSCCGCRQPPHLHFGCSDQGSSGCWSLRCPWPPSRTADEWESARLLCFLGLPWRTDKSQSLCRSTGRSWTGSFGSDCLNTVAVGRCGIETRLACWGHWCLCWMC